MVFHMNKYIESFIGWLRRMFRIYEKEIKKFVIDIVELAFNNLDKQRLEKLNPIIRKKIQNEVLAQIIIQKIDTTTVQGKSAVSRLVLEQIDKFTKE